VSDAERPEPDAVDAAPAPHSATDAPPATDVDGNAIVAPEVLADQALPAIYTRAPRLIRVVTTGAFAGAVLGAFLGAILPSSYPSGRAVVALVMALAGALAGGLIAGTVVATGERREARHVAAAKATSIEEWLTAHPGTPDAGTGQAGTPDAEPEA